MTETRLLQIVVAIACLSPLLIGGMGIVHGPYAFGRATAIPIDLDSHFRYLSGIFFATGFGFLSCVPGIATKTARFRLLGGLIVAGGLSRGLSLLDVGMPSTGHVLGLVMETVIVPLLILWQARIARIAKA